MGGWPPRPAGLRTWVRRFLAGVLERNAKGILETKLEGLDPAARALVIGEDERHHYQDVDLEDIGLQHIVRSFTIDRILFMRQVLPAGPGGIVADLGDTNGIFLRSLGRNELSINISDPAVRSLRAKGMEVIKADIEHLPLRDGTIGAILFYETLEHLPNPIRVLRELGRICSGSLVLSIPSVSMTRIHPSGYDPSRPLPQHHIFEFSAPDFRAILSHTPFELRRDRTAVVLGGGGRILDRIIIWMWSRFREKDMFCGCFLKFYLCHLVVRKEKEVAR